MELEEEQEGVKEVEQEEEQVAVRSEREAAERSKQLEQDGTGSCRYTSQNGKQETKVSTECMLSNATEFVPCRRASQTAVKSD